MTAHSSAAPLAASPTPFHLSQMFETHTKATGQWGLMLVFNGWLQPEHYDDLPKAVPFFSWDDERWMQPLADGYAFLFFDTEEQMLAHYQQVHGDDDVSEHNPYSGPLRIYALTSGPDGLLNENT